MGQQLSKIKYIVENASPRGSISPILFSLKINAVFKGFEKGMGFSLLTDDGAIWKRGRNLQFTIMKIQNVINQIQK